MAPSAVEAVQAAVQTTINVKNQATQQVAPTQHAQHVEPLKLSGVLDQYEHFDVTPIIGREFPKANLVEWLNAPNADELIRDLAITSLSPLHPSPSSYLVFTPFRCSSH